MNSSNTENHILITKDNRIISECLSDLGLSLMSKHAESEANPEILKSYACIAARKAIQAMNKPVLSRLYHGGLITN